MGPEESRSGHETYAGDYRDQQEVAAGQDEWWLRELLARFEAHRRGDQYAAGQAQRLEQGMETREGPALPGTHYPAFDHPTLKSMVDTNLDAGQVNETGAAWNELGNALVDLRTEMSAAANRSEADWSGAAGDAARGYFSGLGEWMGGAGQGFQLAANRMNAESEAAAYAKNTMPEPVDFSVNDAVAMLRGETNPFRVQNTVNQINQKFAEKQEAHDLAAEVMGTYAGSMSESGSGMPVFAPVPTMAGTGDGDAGGPGEPEGGPGGRPGGPSAPMEGGAWNAEPDGDGPKDGGPEGGDPGSRDGGEVPGPAVNGEDQGPGSSSDDSTSGQGVRPNGGGPELPGPGGSGPVTGGPVGVPVGGQPIAAPPIGAVAFGAPGSDGGGRGAGSGGGPGGSGDQGGPRGKGGGAGPGSGVRAVPGALAAEHASVSRGGAGGGGGRGAAGMGMGPMAAGRGQGGEDTEHQRPSWLMEGDPEELFGADEVTAPPVLGEVEPEEE